jgi:hypothetical protein
VENLELPFGQLALAWIGNGSQSDLYTDIPSPDPANKAGFSKGNVDYLTEHNGFTYGVQMETWWSAGFPAGVPTLCSAIQRRRRLVLGGHRCP